MMLEVSLHKNIMVVFVSVACTSICMYTAYIMVHIQYNYIYIYIYNICIITYSKTCP